MPYSSHVFDTTFTKLLSTANCTTFLDIGPGAGKYAKLIRSVHPSAVITAVEIDPVYIERFKLSELYDEVLCMDAMKLITLLPGVAAGMIIMGDVLEHFLYSDGLSLVHYLLYRCNYMFIQCPLYYPQLGKSNHPAEQHRSFWSPSAFPPELLTYTETKRNASVFILSGIPSHKGLEVDDAARKLLLSRGVR